MKCPYCGCLEQRVLESRTARNNEAIRRRRECLQCERRFNTFEEPERRPLYVIKRSGSREEFQREKMFSSMALASRKRPVEIDVLRVAAERIEQELLSRFEDEISSKDVGDAVLAELQRVDVVAFVRFASVYRDFRTVKDFREILDTTQLLETAGREA